MKQFLYNFTNEIKEVNCISTTEDAARVKSKLTSDYVLSKVVNLSDQWNIK